MRMFFAPGPTGFGRSAGLLVWPAASDAEAIAAPEMKSLRFMGPRFSFESRTGKDSTGSNWQLAISNWQLAIGNWQLAKPAFTRGHRYTSPDEALSFVIPTLPLGLRAHPLFGVSAKAGFKAKVRGDQGEQVDVLFLIIVWIRAQSQPLLVEQAQFDRRT